MSVVDLGKVKGTQIYTGTGVTGTTSTGQTFSGSGITTAYVDDLYINVDNTSESKGNIYKCTVGGNPNAAKWGYAGNLRGPKADVVNNLTSTSAESALSAYQGNRLYNFMVEAGVFAKKCEIENDEKIYGVKVTIDNVSTKITLAVGGDQYTYSYEKAGTAAKTTVSISIGTAIGMANNGGVLSYIESSEAYIYAYELTNASQVSIFKKDVEIWDGLNKALQNHETVGEITDGTAFKYGNVYKFLKGVKTLFYPITHAKAVWYDKTKGYTVHDKIGSLETTLGGKAPTSHATVYTTYGKATETLYGHTKLSDSADTNSTASNGVAATPAAVKKAYDKAGEVDKKKLDTAGGTLSGAVTFDAQSTSDGMLKATNIEEILEILRMITGEAPTLIINNTMYQNGKGTLNLCGGTLVQLITSAERIVLENSTESGITANLRPKNDGKCTLGTSDKRFHSLYAANATIQTSDAREKENIIPMDGTATIPTDAEQKDIYSELFNRLNPVQYNFIGSDRTCYGLIAQEVIEAMGELGIGENDLDLVHHKVFEDGTETFGVAYANLIPLLIHEVQKIKARLENIETAELN